ncbi:MAG: hypothetical protein DMG96_31030 [Acidobacteria bacterium]|nr:MAG: hypothetical protein DMG96_31030 [Acidobacteriota bacterium]
MRNKAKKFLIFIRGLENKAKLSSMHRSLEVGEASQLAIDRRRRGCLCRFVDLKPFARTKATKHDPRGRA